ncbi:RBBP9/YdeN family alpha/beta hydrolase [Microbacterium sp. NPDC058389]|uniref:RBBP9/YdeN family alpha/beta hydrolase n=1 Tax=Microbacterium sp. NPDC058389 TaxID=3346475 RepID=UPI003661B95F
MTDKQRLIVIHGYGATPRSHWFPWLAAQVPSVTVEVPELPNPTAPKFDTWEVVAAEAIAAADENTVVIGHSLGAVTALNALAALPEGRRLAGIVLVGGFAEPLPGYAALDAFTRVPLDIEALRALTPNRTVFVSDNDAIVDPAITARLAARFGADLVTVPGAGHFQETEGKTTFPELLPALSAAGITVG